MAAPNVSADGALGLRQRLTLNPVRPVRGSREQPHNGGAPSEQESVERRLAGNLVRPTGSESGSFDPAIEEAQKAIESDESHYAPHFILGEAYLISGRLRQAVTCFKRAHQAAPWNAVPIGLLAGTLFRLGEKDRAAELIGQMTDPPRPVWGRVLYHLLTGEIDAAMDWFEIMVEHREPFALVFARSPLTEPLRRHPRWPALAAMMNLPAA